MGRQNLIGLSDWIVSLGMNVETPAEEIVCMETSMFGNVGFAACIEPPKRPTHTTVQARTSFVLHFGSGHLGIASCGMSVEVAEEQELSMEENDFGNLGLVACTRAPKRLA